MFVNGALAGVDGREAENQPETADVIPEMNVEAVLLGATFLGTTEGIESFCTTKKPTIPTPTIASATFAPFDIETPRKWT